MKENKIMTFIIIIQLLTVLLSMGYVVFETLKTAHIEYIPHLDIDFDELM